MSVAPPLARLGRFTAAKRGLPVMTGNPAGFDLVQQIAPGGAFVDF